MLRVDSGSWVAVNCPAFFQYFFEELLLGLEFALRSDVSYDSWTPAFRPTHSDTTVMSSVTGSGAPLKRGAT